MGLPPVGSYPTSTAPTVPSSAVSALASTSDSSSSSSSRLSPAPLSSPLGAFDAQTASTPLGSLGGLGGGREMMNTISDGNNNWTSHGIDNNNEPQRANPTPTSLPFSPSNPDYYSAIVPHVGFNNPHHESTGKKKRGRPRKYGPDGSIALALSSSPLPAGSGPVDGQPLVQKKVRGRPLGSGKNQKLAALGQLFGGTAGIGFTPHVITVAAGEDVAAKIMSFSQQGPRSVCILSANGAISSVTLRQPAISGGTVSYEGRFEILSLSGSFLLSESGGTKSRTGGLSVSISGPDGRVVGGCVAGLLMAATPVQVVVGSFVSSGPRKTPTPRPITADPLAQAMSPDSTKEAPNPAYPPLTQNTTISFANNNPQQQQQQQQQGPSMAIPLQTMSRQAIPDTAIDISLPGR